MVDCSASAAISGGRTCLVIGGAPLGLLSQDPRPPIRATKKPGPEARVFAKSPTF
jgi:hypothetical protein